MNHEMLRIEGRNPEPITSVEQWHVSAPPASVKHWKPGRSAFELASAWTVGNAAERVKALLELRPELAPVVLERGHAERKTRFDAYRGGRRNHDLLITGTAAGQRLVIGVEGKADEAFDLPLERWRAARLKKTPTSKAPARLDGLTQWFFGSKLDEEPDLGTLGYQLLSTLAGTLADAKTFGAERAVVLV